MLSVTGAMGDPVTLDCPLTLANPVDQCPDGERRKGGALDSSQVQVCPPHHFPAALQGLGEVAGLTPTLQRNQGVQCLPHLPPCTPRLLALCTRCHMKCVFQGSLGMGAMDTGEEAGQPQALQNVRAWEPGLQASV